MSENIQSYINHIADSRARRSIRALFTHFMNDDVSRTFKPITFGVSSGTALDFADAYTGKVIETGTYSSSADKGVALTATNTRPASFLFDDGGDIIASGDIRALLSRIAITALHTGTVTIDAIRGHLKFIGGVDYDADYASGVRGYVEIAGATDFDLNSDDHAVSGLHARVEVAANIAVQQGYLAGLYAELNTTGAYSVTQDADGILAGIVIAITDQKNDAWGHGLYIAASAADTGITMNAITTGISLAGAMTTGIDISGASTEAINITGNTTRAINIDTGTHGTGILLGGTLTTGISIGACTTGLSITGATTTALSVTGNATDVLKTLTGVFTDVIDIGGTVTNAINFTAAATVTNVFKFNAVAGCVVANALVPAAAPDAGTVGADAALVCDINGTPYYIALYDTLHA